MTTLPRRLRTAGLAPALLFSALQFPALTPLTASAAPAGTAVAAGSPVGSYLAGRFAESQDDWRNAERFMTDALAAHPDDAALQRRTLLLRIGEGRIDAALPLATGLLAANAETPLAALLVAADHLRNGRTGEAAAAAARIRQDGVGRVVAALVGGWIDVAGGDADAGLARIQPLSAVQGMQPLYGLHAGLIADVAGRAEEAERHYASILDDEAPLRVIQVVGSHYRRTGRPERARALYAAFQERNPDTVAMETLIAAVDRGEPARPVVADAAQGVAEALFDIGSALQHEGSGDHAMLYARLALHLRPDLALARLLVADLLADRRSADAIPVYETLAADPVLGRMARLRKAEALADADRNEEAIAILRSLDGERPTLTRPLVRLGDLLRGEKRWDEAIAAYTTALERIGTAEERHWPILYARGIAYERTDRWAQAEADFKAALALRPEEPFVLNYLGYSWVDRGLNLAEAKRMVERAVELRPRDGYIVDSLGWALYRLGDYEGAVAKLERAVELKPLDATINDHLGDAYWRVGRRNEARFQWQRALKNAESDEDGEALKQAVREKLEKGLPERQTAGTGPATVR